MRQTAAGTLAFSLFLATLLDPSPAAACGGLPCAERSETQPADGLTNVPLNTEIRVLYFGAITLADTPEEGTPATCSTSPRRPTPARTSLWLLLLPLLYGVRLRRMR